MATGQVSLGLGLQDLKSQDDIKNKIIKTEYFQGHWLVGFGWNQHQWLSTELPTKKILDDLFPDTPVFLSRVDGHASWVNSKALLELKNLGYDFSTDPVGGKIEKDSLGNPTGILFDQAHIHALLRLPRFTREQVRLHILQSIKIFNQAGFTHIRDLSMQSETASLLFDLFNERKLTLCIDGFVTAESVTDLDRAFNDFEKCKSFLNPYLRMQGLKIFVDGSLGSETAAISKPYKGTTGSRGLMAWTSIEIKEALKYCWTRKIEIAVHVIGDEASDIVIQAAREISAFGILGKIHLEHVQLLRPETVNKMKPLHVHCHMQPCHWLSDKIWIKNKIPDLVSYLFQWELLRKNKIGISFGSDSPIEKTSLIQNFKALADSELHGVPKLSTDPKMFHAHPDCAWTNSKTIFDQEKINEVHFNGQKII